MKPHKVMNPAFRLVSEGEDGYVYRGIQGINVIQSVAVEDDGNVWMHTSFSRRGRMPDYHDMDLVRSIFVRPDQKALLIFPDRAHHVNIHHYCLHFFTPMNHDPLPEFSKGGSL